MDSETSGVAVDEPSRPLRKTRFIAVGAGALALVVVASAVYLRPALVQNPGSFAPRSALPAIQPNYALLPISPSTAYVIVGPGGTSPPSLYLTDDSGKTWRRMSLPIPESEQLVGWDLLADRTVAVNTWEISNQKQAHTYVGDGTGWMEVNLPILGRGSPWPRMLNSRLGFYFVIGPSTSVNEHDLTIFRTEDSGGHWDRLVQLDADHPNAGGLSIAEEHLPAFTDQTHGWIVSRAQPYMQVCGKNGWTSAGRLLASDDSGQHWTERGLTPLPDGSAQLGPPVLMRGSVGYMLATVQIYAGKCPPDPVSYVYSTGDGGISWSAPRRLPTNFFWTANGTDWWAAVGKRILRSRDQGLTWTSKVARLPTHQVRVGDLYPVGQDVAWSLANPAIDQISRVTLLRTSDGGATWSEVKLPPASS